MWERVIILALVMLGYCTTALAQEGTTQPVSQSSYDSLVSQLDYDKTKKKLQFKEFKTEKKDVEKVESPKLPNLGGIGEVGKVIAYMLIVALIVGLLYWLSLGMQAKDEKINIKEVDLHTLEDISEIDAVSAYDEAVANGDYRLALRLRFVQSLQLLSEREYIRWKPDKTNRNYVRELSQHRELQGDFRQIAQIYEWVWYGHTDIDEATFRRLDQDHQTFHKKMTDEE